MSQENLRNVITGEVVEVDNGSAEYRKMRDETYEHSEGGAIKPLWEITSAAHADRMDAGYVREEDMGYQNKPLTAAPAIDRTKVVFGQRHKQLTPAEVKNGLTNYDQKRSELDDMVGTRPGKQSKPDPIPVDERRERGEQQAGRSQTRSGGRGKGRSGSGGNSGGSGSGSGSGDGSGSGS